MNMHLNCIIKMMFIVHVYDAYHQEFHFVINFMHILNLCALVYRSYQHSTVLGLINTGVHGGLGQGNSIHKRYKT